MPILCLLAAIVIAALMFAAVYAFSYGIAKVALKVLPESDPNEGLPMCARNNRRSKIPGLPLLKWPQPAWRIRFQDPARTPLFLVRGNLYYDLPRL